MNETRPSSALPSQLAQAPEPLAGNKTAATSQPHPKLRQSTSPFKIRKHIREEAHGTTYSHYVSLVFSQLYGACTLKVGRLSLQTRGGLSKLWHSHPETKPRSSEDPTGRVSGSKARGRKGSQRKKEKKTNFHVCSPILGWQYGARADSIGKPGWVNPVPGFGGGSPSCFAQAPFQSVRLIDPGSATKRSDMCR